MRAIDGTIAHAHDGLLGRFPGRWPGNARTIDADYTGHIPSG